MWPRALGVSRWRRRMRGFERCRECHAGVRSDIGIDVVRVHQQTRSPVMTCLKTYSYPEFDGARGAEGEDACSSADLIGNSVRLRGPIYRTGRTRQQTANYIWRQVVIRELEEIIEADARLHGERLLESMCPA